MEENKSKKSEGVSLVALIIIVILIIALAMSIICILKTSKQEITVNSSNREQTINALRTEVANLKNTIAQKENEIKNNENKEHVTQTKEMTSDEKYDVFLKKMKEEITSLKDPSYIWGNYELNGGDKGSYSVKLNSKCKLSVSFSDEELERKFGTNSLATDVIAFYNVYVGNGGDSFLYFIKSDGTLWKAYVDGIAFGEKKISVEKLTEYKNIVSIMQIYDAIDKDYPGSMNVAFIDIDGKIHK